MITAAAQLGQLLHECAWEIGPDQGIALLTVITASVTATLIEQARQRRATESDAVLAKLEQIESRLGTIEEGLWQR